MATAQSSTLTLIKYFIHQMARILVYPHLVYPHLCHLPCEKVQF